MSIFFFNDTATTEIYTLSLHDALPISKDRVADLPTLLDALRRITSGETVVDQEIVTRLLTQRSQARELDRLSEREQDRKSTRLNSSHANISYAVFCLKKKNNLDRPPRV